MDENLKIQRFEVPPSASNFEFLIESRDVPAVLVGGVMDWRSLSEWISYNGGLGNLQAFKSVLDKYLGVNLNGPNPGS
ncbi:uncharacterized protein LOC111456538 isoform X6 [Cucurbita moschata]|uniref:Uncharacterized protein LOC111456538 isoform X6 n=1 Tax=Cucurbita moschata TaxID=3662 RepID=A0A6J1GSC7_CUCMO|nr:uncharacterized protein LOC111456538 isoform X6 [Cucurbita moschata]